MQPSKKILAIILAAGNSERFNDNKLFFEIDGIPVLQRTIENVLSVEQIDSILIVNSKKDELKIQNLLNQINSDKKIFSVYGGKNRAESLVCAIDFITDQKLNIDYLVVHDGARPFTKKNMFYQGIKNIEDYDCVIFGLTPTDTVKIITDDNFVEKTLIRDKLINVQTPQFFKKEILLENITTNKNLNTITDDSSFLDNTKYKVKVLPGDENNIKITTQNDVSSTSFYGIGFDLHKLIPEKKLRLGGIDIDFPFKLEGHSDGDVLIHSIIDSVLGGCNLGDIGKFYPSNDKSLKNIDSTQMLSEISQLIKDKGFEIIYIDVTVIAQKPRISSYTDQMKNRLSEILRINEKNINIKSTTTDKMGIIGSENAIGCQTIATIKKR